MLGLQPNLPCCLSRLFSDGLCRCNKSVCSPTAQTVCVACATHPTYGSPWAEYRKGRLKTCFTDFQTASAVQVGCVARGGARGFLGSAARRSGIHARHFVSPLDQSGINARPTVSAIASSLSPNPTHLPFARKCRVKTHPTPASIPRGRLKNVFQTACL